ncbi:hypothetical protein [Fontibacillus sp. BL9]|uniref:hypothetical protein n=1 Tax=Fontibacillus sp. BL9 TaxID=3389971 RepID=UPI00397D63B9
MRVKQIAVALFALSLLLSACGNHKNGESATYAESGNNPETNGREIIDKGDLNDLSGSLDETQMQPEVTGPAPGSEPTSETGSSEADHPSDKEMMGTAGQLYSLAFHAMFEMDEGLNSDMKYISIDFSELTQLTEQDKAYIMASFDSYGVEVRDAAFDELKQEEGFKDKLVLEGILLQVKKVDVSEAAAVIEGSKYRAGNGAIGTKITLKLEDGSWSVSDAGTTWIS